MVVLYLLCFAVGFVVGLLNVALIVRFVAHLHPETRFIQFKTLRSALLRIGLATFVFGVTFPLGWQAGVSAFAGLWLARWVVVLWIPKKMIQDARIRK